MVNIEYISGQGTFKFNGETRVRNYHSQVSGEKVRIVNAYDTDDWLLQYTHYSDISLNGTVYGSAFELAEVLAPVLFQKSTGSDEGSTSVSGNIITKVIPVQINWTQNASQQIVNFVNGQQFVVLGTQRILFKAVRIIGDINTSNAAEFHFWEFKPGKGSYGVGGTSITGSDIEYSSFVTNSQNNVINLGEIGTTPIEIAVNDSGPYGINSTSLNIFKTLRNGSAANYIYAGTSTSVGIGATQTTSADYIDVNATPVNPPSSTGGLDVPEEEGFVPVSQADGSLIWLPYSSGGSEEPNVNPTELISFTSNWQQGGLTFNPYAEWRYNGVLDSDSRELTADPADPTLPRYDLFIINLTTGQIEILKGTASANRTYPELTDPATQLDTGIFIDIPAGATQPAGVTGDVVYAEGDAGEWTVTSNGAINTASTDSPHSGSVNIEATLNDGQYIQFTAPDPVTSKDKELPYWIQNILGGSHHWIFFGTTAKNGRPGSWTVGSPGNYNVSSTAWQAQSIPFPAEISQVTSIRLVSGRAGLNIKLDDVRVIGGGGTIIIGGDYADKRLSNVASDLSEAEKTAIQNKLGITREGNGTPTLTYYTSDRGAISDADVSLGSTTFGTDNFEVLQALLDEALTHPIVVMWDGKYSVSGALTIHSNTTIIGANGGGVILRDHSNSPVFVNANRVAPSPTGGFGSNIIDENIKIENLIINGNGYNEGPTGSDVFDVENQGSATKGSAQTKLIPMIDFLGVKEIHLNNVKLWAGRYWSTSLCNVEKVHIKDLDIDFGQSSTRDDINYDGLHFNGYARWIYVDGVRVKGTADDALAINADANPDYQAGKTGDITDCVFENFYFYETTRGIRILSDFSRIDRLTFNNFKGYVGDLFCLIQGGFWSTAENDSDYGNLYFNDIDIEVFNAPYYISDSYFWIEDVKLESLNINNVVRKSYDYASPYIQILGASDIQHINLTNVREIVPPSQSYSAPFISMRAGSVVSFSIDNVRRSTSGGNFTSKFIEASGGSIVYLNISNYIHRETSPGLSAPIVFVSGATINYVSFTRITLASIGTMFNHSGGSVSRIEASQITMVGGGINEIFFTHATINYLILSGLSFLNGAKITSGTFLYKSGDGFTYRPTEKASLPDASQYQSCALVTDESGGAVPAFSDGTNWRRVTDRTIVS